MFENNKESCGTLYRIINDICNGSRRNVNCTLTLLDTVYSLYLVKGSEYSGLSEYLDVFTKLSEAAIKAGWFVADERLRDMMIADLKSSGKSGSYLFKKLEDWKDALKIGTKVTEEVIEKTDLGKKALNDRYLAGVFVRRAGERCTNYRREQSNQYTIGTDNYAQSVTQAYIAMEQWQPPKLLNYKSKTLNKEVSGTMNMVNTSEVTCFNCERKGHVNKECTFDTKEDGSPLNTREEKKKIYDDFARKRRERQRANRKNDNNGANTEEGNVCLLDSATIPNEGDIMSFEDAIAQVCDHDGHLFSIDSYVIDLRGSNSAYNYASESNCKSFEVLLDNQSTCDVIVNNIF